MTSPHRQRGFCFAEFASHEAAHSALKSLGRTPCPLPELLEAEGGSLKVDWCVQQRGTEGGSFGAFTAPPPLTHSLTQ